MPIFVTLYKLTDRGARDIKGAPARVEAVKKAWQNAGGKTIGWYVLEGEYDYVGIFEAPNEDTAVKVNAAVVAKGNVRSKTMRAYTQEQFNNIVSKIS